MEQSAKHRKALEDSEAARLGGQVGLWDFGLGLAETVSVDSTLRAFEMESWVLSSGLRLLPTSSTWWPEPQVAVIVNLYRASCGSRFSLQTRASGSEW